MANRNYFAVLPLDPPQDPTNSSITTNGAPASVALAKGASSTDIASTNRASTSFCSDLRARYSRLQATEDAKDALIEDALSRYDSLALQCEALLKGDVDHLDCKKRENMYKQQALHLERLLDREPFILVLIDGNSMLFHEVLAHDGEFGGRRSALLLKSDIAKWVPENLISPPSEYKIIVKVFADFRLLSKLYGGPEFQAFARGFNSFGDLVDCGGGDPIDKVIDHFKLFVYNYNCHQVLLGCGHQTLEGYYNDTEANSRVTLIQSTVYEVPNFPFKQAHFPGIFGSGQKSEVVPAIISSSVGSCIGTPATPAMPTLGSSPNLALRSLNGRSDSLTSSVTSADAPGDSWAKRAHAAAALPQTSTVARVSETSAIRRNKKGQRIDPAIPDFDPVEHDRVKKLKLCNKYYLHPEGCSADNCHHRHDCPITRSEVKALRRVAREVVCNNGLECDDAGCVYGHCCPYPVAKEGSLRGLGCINGHACRFPQDMHGIKA